MANLKISQLTELSESDGTEYTEVIVSPFTPGTNRKVLTSKLAVTREFSRAFSEEILFNKNEIDYELHVLTGDITYTIAPTGHLTDQFSAAVQTITVDGTQSINFSGFQFVYGITTGDIPEAGTYQVFFLYRNGVSTATWPTTSSESSTLEPLSAPANFAAVANGGDVIDLTWDAVANASGYELYYSLTGTGGWTLLSSLDSGDVSYSHTGLSAGVTFFYRIRAMGDLVIYNNSLYSTTSATTETAGDVTAPTFTFSPTSGATDPAINKPIIITANEPIRKDDGTTLTNANIATQLRVKQTNVGGSNIPFTATIDAGKTIITITPVTHWGVTQLVYVDIDNVEDVNGNEIAGPISSTFTTTDFTLTENNFLNFGTQLDPVIEGNNIDFELEMVCKGQVLSGTRSFFAKINTGGANWSFIFQAIDDDVIFRWYGSGGSPTGSHRTLTWSNVLTTGTMKVTLKYFGAIDTNNGLDRGDLYIDDVLQGGKALTASGTATWPFGIPVNTSPLYVGRPYAEVKDIVIRNSSGTVIQLDVPVMRDGTDVSGNSFDGTWITL